MNFFENKKIYKKVIISALIVILFGFAFSGNVHAAKDGIGRKIIKSSNIFGSSYL